MNDLIALLNRYKKAEEWFEDDSITIETKLNQVENLQKLINGIDKEYKRLKLTQEQLKNEMIKANIEVGEV